MKNLVVNNTNTTKATATMTAVNNGIQKVLDFLNKEEKTEEDAVAIAEFVCKPLPNRPAVTEFSDAIFDGMYQDGICSSGLEKVEFWKELTAPGTKTRQKMQNLGMQLIWLVEEDLHLPDLSIEKMNEEEFSKFILNLAEKGDQKHLHTLLLGVALDCDMWSKFDGWSFNKLYEAAKVEAHVLDNEELGYGDNWD